MKNTLKILIVEDSEDDALIIILKIRKSGYNIEYSRVENAEVMKQKLLSETWDVVLSDYVMPNFSGLEALSILKETGIDLPFIIVSGTIGEDVAVDAMKKGAHDYIMKDNLQRLVPAIERELIEAKSREEHRLLEIKEKEAKLALKESEELFKILLKLAPYSIVLTDLDNHFILANDCYYESSGISEAMVAGKTLEEQGFSIDPISQQIIENQMKLNGRVENLEMTVTSVNSAEKILIYSCLNINWKDKPMILHSYIDITEKKKVENELAKYREHLELLVRERTEELQKSNEELHAINKELYIQREELQTTLKELNNTKQQLVQSEKMASLGILSAGIAHEINNPLNFIMASKLALESLISTRFKDDVDDALPLFGAIDEGVNRVSAIVTSLNHYSRQDDLPKTICDVHAVIDNCLVILNNQLKDKVEVFKNYTQKTHLVLASEGKLHQAFLNIINNAEQSIDKKGVIRIETYLIDKNLIVKISDTGSGIDPDIIDKIFDPFFTTKPPGKGTGLGLSITYNIIREINGTIGHESEPGKGTVVKVKLPIFSENGN